MTLRAGALVLLAAFVPSTAAAFQVGTATTPAGRLRFEAGAQVFARGLFTAADNASFDPKWGLTRARLSLDVHLDPYLRVLIEPDFGGAEADLADVFLEVQPSDAFEVRVGQAKVPFGVLETLGRFHLPVLRRGMINDVISDRIGAGGRRFGLFGRLKLSDVPLKPSLEISVHPASLDPEDVDGAVRAAVRPIKGLTVHAAGYTRAGAALGGDNAWFGALSALFDRRHVFVAAEVQLGRYQLLLRDGTRANLDATLWDARLVAAYEVPIVPDLDVQPYVAVEVMDPNTATGEDRGAALKGGLNLFFLDALRVGAEIERQASERGFLSPQATRITVLAAVKLE